MSHLSPDRMDTRFAITDLNGIEPLRCPCGWTQRAFTNSSDAPASIHQVTIEVDSRTHYHKQMTEIYVVLEGEGQIEVDGQTFPLKPMTAVMIHPGCRHRAIGKLRILNVAIPKFDPADEWFD